MTSARNAVRLPKQVVHGATGIGEASARALLVKGRAVTITGRDEAKLAKAAQRLSAHGGDHAVTSSAWIARLVLSSGRL